MDPFLTYINFCYNTRQTADNQCYLHPQCTVDALLAWYQASHWGGGGGGRGGKKIGEGKKKATPFFAFFPTAEPGPRLTSFLCRAMFSEIAWLASRETRLGS